MSAPSLITSERQRLHARCIERLLVFDRVTLTSGANKGTSVRCASNADAGNAASRTIANNIADQLGAVDGKKLEGQTSGNVFEQLVEDFLASTFPQLEGIRPGKWRTAVVTERTHRAVSSHEQYLHLDTLSSMAEADKVLKASLGNDYTVAPDILVSRSKYSDDELNAKRVLVDGQSATRGAMRLVSGAADVLHASISCKWTMRSDRAQNSRAEALNLIRNRKGRVPHIIAVVGEPTPSRLASLALGTGDLDCVYHFALYELQKAVRALGQSEAIDLLEIMVEGRRLKDISDLPLDLAV